jgi:hypothetical protein
LQNRLASLDGGSSVLAVVGGTLRNGLGLVARSSSLELLADSLDAGSASTSDGSSSTSRKLALPQIQHEFWHIPEVGVDTRKNLAVVGLDVLDDNAAGHRVLAVSAGAVELAEVGNLEAIDGDGALAVVLDDLVGSSLSTSTADGGVTVTLQGESILADVDPPDVPGKKLVFINQEDLCRDVLNGTRALTVNTLDLVLSDNGILESATVLDSENSILVSTLNLACAWNTTAVGLHATIEDTGDRLRCLKSDRALGGRDGKGSASVQAGESGGSTGSRSSGDGCDECSNGGNGGNGELHVFGWRW